MYEVTIIHIRIWDILQRILTVSYKNSGVLIFQSWILDNIGGTRLYSRNLKMAKNALR